MKIQILSDLHFEFHADNGNSFVEGLDASGVDVLVLAGDICSVNQLKNTFDIFSTKYKNIIFVPGNHEYYKSSFDVVNAELKKYVHVLNPGVLTLDGIKFVGATMWFEDRGLSRDRKNCIGDYFFIKDHHKIGEFNKEHVRFLEENAEDAVVITHHLPSYDCVSYRFAGSPLNVFFVHSMDRMIKILKPKLWIHGHTHDSVDCMIGDTRVVANPFGYPREINPQFIEKFLVET